MLTLNSDAKVKVNNDLTASRLTKPHLPYFHILVHIAGQRREARMYQIAATLTQNLMLVADTL